MNKYTKWLLLPIAMALPFMTSCKMELVGNKEMIETEVAVSPFEKIDSQGSANVRFHKSEEIRVVYTIDSNLAEYVEIFTNRNNTLIIKFESYDKSFSYTRFEVDIYAPSINGISMSGSGSFSTKDTLTAQNFDAVISGSARIVGNIESQKLAATISGSGSISLSGQSAETSLVITGSGDYNGDDFNADDAVITITGSGRVVLNVSDSLNVRVTGSGTVRYRGNPKISSSITGSGRLINIE